MRRRRNNPTWATTGFDPEQCVCRRESDRDGESERVSESETESSVHIKSETDTTQGLEEEREGEGEGSGRRDYSVAEQLTMCWGVGPSKVSLT